jgi:hypothetical protein
MDICNCFTGWLLSILLFHSPVLIRSVIPSEAREELQPLKPAGQNGQGARSKILKGISEFHGFVLSSEHRNYLKFPKITRLHSPH